MKLPLNERVKPLEFKMLDVKKLDFLPDTVVATYNINYQNLPVAGRVVTGVEQVLELKISPGQTVARIDVADCKAPSTAEAIEKLAEWLEALAYTLRCRKRMPGIPLFQIERPEDTQPDINSNNDTAATY